MENAEGSTILISSHDLAEIESFASHVGYLEHGRLQFSEEMGSLTQRFREIEITLPAPGALPPDWPATWLLPESAAAVVRFVETQFDSERTLAEVRRVFGEVLQVAVNPMPLRAIFVTLAKTGREAA
jgi:ABC-2 type transport system ATP-binding protein